ncbi:OadG family transporter subunit [Colwellia sp. 4_MG-2023]|uniref:OadG family protein n=1 Tax=unclassified Colwellia TaxID=196834 RepID=UPI001C0A5D47|nr:MULTISPECIES: OadG family transporter subunit [unclassified Colwellia]MBU2923294.1 OadG family protein [Colwellia sp. C2M11]MDO6489418.1 OadG family transporter subunit [Colwellia sp. 6_MG-2023]MDO6507005.1 OadG family transporter subunit [Colwellia sp. 5_MG-2023]MDO6557201.1 OadG family transporter subunit [Colwellia sp. 4_MG-2023]MDO6653985.1 OadG family transporter subunit [Colwellia sp. 3_MG-2023]
MNSMEHQFIEAGTLMLAGMVFVFAFLSLLIIFINTVLARLAVKFPDAITPSRSHSSTKNKKAVSGEISPAIVAAISGSISQYRHKHSTQYKSKR